MYKCACLPNAILAFPPVAVETLIAQSNTRTAPVGRVKNGITECKRFLTARISKQHSSNVINLQGATAAVQLP